MDQYNQAQDDEVEESTVPLRDDRLSFLEAFRQLVQYSEIDHERKEYFLNLLTEARYSSMSTDEAIELMGIMEKTSLNLEEKLLESNDPDLINDLADMKEFTNDLLNEAEEKGYRMVLGNDAGASEQSARTGQWLLNKFAGLEE